MTMCSANAATGSEWRLHDLRRTVVMAESPYDGGLGIQPHIIEALLNHSSGHKAGVAGIYNHAAYKAEIKTALLRWSHHVTNIVGIVDETENNVVPLKQSA